jgi:hypothetical protein
MKPSRALFAIISSVVISITARAENFPRFVTFSPERVDYGCSFNDAQGVASEVSVVLGSEILSSRDWTTTVTLSQRNNEGLWEQQNTLSGLWQSPAYHPELKFVQYLAEGLLILESAKDPFLVQTLDDQGDQIAYFHSEIFWNGQPMNDVVCAWNYSP